MSGFTIRVSELVFRHLQQHGETFRDTPDTVLRRLLGLPETDSCFGEPQDLVRNGLIKAGDTITWKQPRKGHRHTIEISECGCLLLPTGEHVKSFSKASNYFKPGSGNGRRGWALPDGTTIESLYQQLEEQDHPHEPSLDSNQTDGS